MSTTNPIVDTTEWEDLQVKYGNFEARQKEITEEELTNIAIDFAEQHNVLETKTLEQLEELEDEVEEDILEKHRRQRLEELRRKAAAYKFGSVYHLHKDGYTVEVNDASQNNWVVVHLYRESNAYCILLNRAIEEVARNFGAVKFMKAISTDVIPNYPDANLPTVLLYRRGTCAGQIVGATVWGADQLSPQTVEWVLASYKILETEQEENPLQFLKDADGVSGRGGRTRVAYFGKALHGRDDEDSEDDREYSSMRVGKNTYW